MIYVVGLLTVTLVFFITRRFAAHLRIFEPFSRLGFFKLHYMIAGIGLAFFFPDNYSRIFDPARVTIITFSLGWIGLYYGCGLELRAHQRYPAPIILLNIVEPMIVFALISTVSALYLFYLTGGWNSTDTALMIGLFSSFTIFRRRGILYRQSESGHHPVLDNLLPVGNIFPVAAIAVTGKLLFDLPHITIFSQAFTGPFSFFVFQILAGLLGGVLLNMLISAARSQYSIAVILIGGVVLIGGIAATLSFSSLFVGMLTGAFLINSTLKRLQTLDMLNRYHEHIEKIFMFCLGTMITPVIKTLHTELILILLGAIGLFALRAVIKYGLSSLWISRSMGKAQVSPALWIGLMGQGIVASGAVIECSYHVRNFSPIFLLFMATLVLNQIAIGLYVGYSERTVDYDLPQRLQDAKEKTQNY